MQELIDGHEERFYNEMGMSDAVFTQLLELVMLSGHLWLDLSEGVCCTAGICHMGPGVGDLYHKASSRVISCCLSVQTMATL